MYAKCFMKVRTSSNLEGQSTIYNYPMNMRYHSKFKIEY